jgi:hypothetical protein
MEIVEAQGVREVLFDPDTGRPIRATNEAAGPTLHSSNEPAGPVPLGGNPEPGAAADDTKMLDEFPLDLNQPQ